MHEFENMRTNSLPTLHEHKPGAGLINEIPINQEKATVCVWNEKVIRNMNMKPRYVKPKLEPLSEKPPIKQLVSGLLDRGSSALGSKQSLMQS